MAIVTINAIDCSKFKNAEHIQFHSNVRDIIDKADTEKLGLSDVVFNPYVQAVSQEQDIVNKSAASLITPQMEELNKKRIKIFRYVRRIMSAAEYADSESQQGAAWPLIKKYLIDQYKSTITGLPYQELTATLSGFLMDVRQQLDAEVIEELGIDPSLDDLQAANRNFSRQYQERLAERAANIKIASNVLREATDATYQHLVVVMNGLANDPLPANKTKAEAAVAVIEIINIAVAEARQRLNQRLGKGKGEESGTTTGGTTGGGTGGGTQGSTSGGSGTKPGGNTSGGTNTRPGGGSDDDDTME